MPAGYERPFRSSPVSGRGIIKQPIWRRRRKDTDPLPLASVDCDGAMTMRILNLCAEGKPSCLLDIKFFDGNDKEFVLANCGSVAPYFADPDDKEAAMKKIALMPHIFGEAGECIHPVHFQTRWCNGCQTVPAQRKVCNRSLWGNHKDVSSWEVKRDYILLSTCIRRSRGRLREILREDQLQPSAYGLWKVCEGSEDVLRDRGNWSISALIVVLGTKANEWAVKVIGLRSNGKMLWYRYIICENDVPGSWGQKSSCKRACIRFLAFCSVIIMMLWQKAFCGDEIWATTDKNLLTKSGTERFRENILTEEEGNIWDSYTSYPGYGRWWVSPWNCVGCLCSLSARWSVKGS